MWPHKPTTKNNQTIIPKEPKEYKVVDRLCFHSVLICRFPLIFALILLFTLSGCAAAETSLTTTDPNNNPNNDCYNFTHGNDYEIVSPRFPGPYPSAIECIRIIEASPGYAIKLQFRDRFDIELSNGCADDFIEIRDGEYVYSKRLGRFCGHTFPQDLTSSGRHLWLMFKTDDNTEYAGFKIVYQFIKQAQPDRYKCRFELSGEEETFGTKDISPQVLNHSMLYPPLHCIWNITVPPNKLIYVTIDEIQLKQPNECELNYVAFYTSLSKGSYGVRFCGLGTEIVTSNTSTMYVVYYATLNATNGTFKALFTAFRKKPSTGSTSCNPDEFDCGDDTCISESLRCNKNKNCKYQYDEDSEVCEGASSLSWLNGGVQIILIVGLGLILSILVPSFWNCYRKIKDDGSDSNGGAAGEMSTQTSMGQRTVEGSLHEHQLVGVTNSGSYEGQTNVGANMEDDEDDGCYVPEVDLSVFIQRSNGGHVITQHDPPFCGQETSLDSTHPFDSADPLIATAPPPPILPLVPQRLAGAPHSKNLRNALQNGHPRVPMRPLRTSTPSDQPLHPHQMLPQDANGNASAGTDNNSSYGSENENNNSFLTFLPPPPTLEEVEESDAIFGLPPTAAASGRVGGGGGRGSGIRMHNHPNRFKAEAIIEMQNRRPLSFESTKSAPDVIGRV